MRRRDRARHRREREEIDVRLEAVRPSGPSAKSQFRRKPKWRRHRQRSPLKRLALAGLLFFGAVYVVYLLVGLVPGGGEEPVTVAVEKGETLTDVAGKLEQAGVVRSALLFRLETRIRDEETEMKAGEYEFTPGEVREEILATLASGESVPALTITIPEGLTLEQTARVVEEQGGIPAEEFEAAANRADYEYNFLDGADAENAEGFLFPKQYEFEKGVGAGQVVDRLLRQYQIETEGFDFAAAGDRLGLTEYELVTTASLIEEEAANLEERPMIASVIYNRIRAGMPLQIDATILYILGESKENLKLDDLEVDSPFNTYTNPGLPPGPIASPSRESIEAALRPADTNYLYYVLETGGEEHFFTDDYEEFLEAKHAAEEER